MPRPAGRSPGRDRDAAGGRGLMRDLTTFDVLLCDADGCLFASEEPAFAASAGVTNRLLAELGSRRRFEAEELRLATTGKNFRSTARWLAAQEGLPLDDIRLEHWVEVEKREVTAHLASVLRPDPAVSAALTALSSSHRLAVV